MLKTIGVVTSGGDAPGMNAAIRGVTRVAYSKNFKVLGFEKGWEGLLTNTVRQLTPRSVSGILDLGGTILQTSRCPEFKKKEAIKKATETLALHNVDGLVVIGGGGSLQGALELSKETDAAIIGVPASIDNDIYGTDETIGFDTAANTAINEIDKIRDTAASLERIFMIEVMGRTRGFLALTVGVAAGAEMILIPEVKYENDEIFRTVTDMKERGKRSIILVAAEGIGDTRRLANEIERCTGLEVRLSVLGYTQRGGDPSARSRLLACQFAEEAVELISEQQKSRLVILQKGEVTSMSLEDSCKTQKVIDLRLLKLAKILAT